MKIKTKKSIGIMATFPSRESVCPKAIKSLLGQFTKLVVVMNEYASIPSHFPKQQSLEYVLPEVDYKDVGKFSTPTNGFDYIFTCDDDIMYPRDYATTMIEHYSKIPIEKKCLGLHVCTYSDLFDGNAKSRMVRTFWSETTVYELVNQIGTGTLLTKPEYFPSFDYMRSSQKFVDVRYARFCFENDIAMIAVPKESGWLKSIETETTIYDDFTKKLPPNVVNEILTFSGLCKLNSSYMKTIVSLSTTDEIRPINPFQVWLSRFSKKMARSTQKRIKSIKNLLKTHKPKRKARPSSIELESDISEVRKQLT